MDLTKSNFSPSEEDCKMEIARQIFKHAVDAVRPANLIRSHVTRVGSGNLKFCQHVIDISKISGIRIVGFGKAVLPMAEELVKNLEGNQLRSCILSVPVGTRPSVDPRIEMYRGAKNNIPDADAFNAAQKITHNLSLASPSDLVIVLISGGGSALLPFPKPPITLQEKSDTIRALSRAGADITELNTVRRELSMVKGGQLLNFCQANQIVSLILSDVLGDDLEIIASGPTVVHKSSRTYTALDIIHRYGLSSVLSANVKTMLTKATEMGNNFQEFQNAKSTDLSRIKNLVVGNNLLALNAAAVAANDALYHPVILTSMLDSEARIVGDKIAQICDLVGKIMEGQSRKFELNLNSILEELQIGTEVKARLQDGINTVKNGRYAGICLLLGGETTVKVNGTGIGGRNQELALSAAMTLRQLGTKPVVVLCSGGTDGIDGPCDAAGAIVTTTTVDSGLATGIIPNDFLENNDSYNYFKLVQNRKFHLVTGHTETNVMDIVICLISTSKSTTTLTNSNL